MTARSTDTESTTAFEALSDVRRRYLLAILLGRSDSSPVSVSTLATDVASMERDHPIVTDEQVERSTVRLVHVDVPKLADLGVITRSSEGATDNRGGIAIADHPMFEAEWVRTLLETPAGATCDASTIDRTLEVLCDSRRRTVLEVLANRRGSIAIADLAVLVVAAREEKRLFEVTEAESKPVETVLVHKHLPALADAGLAEFGGERVAIDPDAPQFDADWFAASPVGRSIELCNSTRNRAGPARTTAFDAGTPGPRSVATDASESQWTIDGREAVIARGHELADGATDELFVTVADAGLLQDRCLDRWAAAADRGVDVYVASNSEEVRDVVRSASPEITVCEPRFDWINFPTDRVNPGRIVFADRQAVMLVTMTDGDDDPRPIAITGGGSTNPLVLLAREHLGPRLDRLETHGSDGSDGDESAVPIPM